MAVDQGTWNQILTIAIYNTRLTRESLEKLNPEDLFKMDLKIDKTIKEHTSLNITKHKNNT